MKRSGLLRGLGGLLAFLGLLYLVSPPPGLGTGERSHDPYSFFICVWFFVSGVGVFTQRLWGYWTYIAGLLLMLTATVINSARHGQPWSDTLQVTLLMAAILGLPAFLIWLKRDRLEVGFWQTPTPNVSAESADTEAPNGAAVKDTAE